MARKAAARASDTEGSDEQTEETAPTSEVAAVPTPVAVQSVEAPEARRRPEKSGKKARKIKLGAFKYRVPASMNPGVQRAGVAFYCVGDTYAWPDGAYKPGDILSNKLIPLDEESRDELVRHEEIRRQRIADAAAKRVKPMTPEEKIVAVPKADLAPEVTVSDDTLTVAELARQQGGTEVRVSDK